MASHTPGSIFEEARERVSREVDGIVACLHQKRDRMLEEIGGLERESEGRQREKQKDISKLNTLIAHTEELGQNSLLELRQEIINNLKREISKLESDISQGAGYGISIVLGFNRKQLIQDINRSKLEVIRNRTADESTLSADCLVLSDASESSEDLNTELALLPSDPPSASDAESDSAVPERSCRTSHEFRDPPREDIFQRGVRTPECHGRRDGDFSSYSRRDCDSGTYQGGPVRKLSSPSADAPPRGGYAGGGGGHISSDRRHRRGRGNKRRYFYMRYN